MIRRMMLVACAVAVWQCSGTDARAQFDAGVDWLYFSRNNSSDLDDAIIGPDGFSSSDAGFGFSSGYRLNARLGLMDYELEAIFSQIHNLDASESGQLARPLTFDNTFNNPLVVGAGNTPANRLGFVTPLVRAAGFNDGAVIDETLEGELLTNAALRMDYSTNYDDFELNFGPNRNQTRGIRLGIGYRHLQLNEAMRFGISGQFNAIDVDDGALPGDATNDPNDGLSDGALTAAGYTLLSGGGDGWDAVTPTGLVDTVTLGFGSAVENEMNGAQLVLSGFVVDNPSFQLDAFAKAGLFYNRISASITEVHIGSGNDDSIYTLRHEDNNNRASFAGSAGLRANWQVAEHVAIVGGYEGILLTGVALAPDQYTGTGQDIFGNNTFSVDDSGFVILHGARIGINILW